MIDVLYQGDLQRSLKDLVMFHTVLPVPIERPTRMTPTIFTLVKLLIRNCYDLTYFTLFHFFAP